MENLHIVSFIGIILKDNIQQALFAAIISFVLLYVLVRRLKINHRYWKYRNVPYVEPNLIFGNLPDLVRNFGTLEFVSYINFLDKYYYKCEKYIGFFFYHKPYLIMKDLDLIKRIMNKDFHHFRNRGLDVYSEDNYLSDNLLFNNYERWKPLRKTLAPLFTKYKMKDFFHAIKAHTDKLTDGLKSKEGQHLDIKQFSDHFIMDIVCDVIFGYKTDCLNNSAEQFLKIGQMTVQPNLIMQLHFMLRDCVPFLLKLRPLDFIGKTERKFLLNAVTKVLSDKKKKQKPDRLDFFDSLAALGDANFASSETDELLKFVTAQCVAFFLAGYETSALTVSFCLMELAKNPEIQLKVQKEIDQLLQTNDDQLSYELLQKSVYLDMVLSETLRLYPPAFFIARKCTSQYTIPGIDVLIDEGASIIIPVYSIHRDKRYYNDPEKFSPENFSPEIISARHPFAYLPFGEGPKICIGKSFAMLQIKLTLISILRNYDVKISEKMVFPITFVPFVISARPKDPIWLKLFRRNKSKTEN